jgi:uncharacterized protein YbaR (Trm112 family)
MMVVCPYCKKEINGETICVEQIQKKAFKFSTQMFSCPHCNAVIGFASNA